MSGPKRSVLAVRGSAGSTSNSLVEAVGEPGEVLAGWRAESWLLWIERLKGVSVGFMTWGSGLLGSESWVYWDFNIDI